jgi:hypothetical protein
MVSKLNIINLTMIAALFVLMLSVHQAGAETQVLDVLTVAVGGAD